MLSQISYQHRNSSLPMLLLHKQTWVDGVSYFELRELIIKATYSLELGERKRFQTKLITDYRNQPTINKQVGCAAGVN